MNDKLDRDCEHSSCETNNLKSDETDSLIAKLFDQFNLKANIIKISKKTSFEVTSQFLDALILFSFLSLVFLDAGILKAEYSFYMVALVVIGISAVIELIYVNTSLFSSLKKKIGRDANTKRFLQKVEGLSPKEAKEEMKNLYFSSKCMNYFLHDLKERSTKYPPYIIESIITKQPLSKENFDLLFSSEILDKITQKTIIEVLIKYRDCLTSEHVINTYNEYHKNDTLIRILIATQSSSRILTDLYNNNQQLQEYYEKYQVSNSHLGRILKLINLEKFQHIQLISFWILFFLFLVMYTGGQIVRIETITDILALFTACGVLAILISHGLLGIIYKLTRNYYYKHYIYNVLNT